MRSKKVAIIQSNYIPWKGYFDIINQVDEFILYDDVQYTRRDWRNRNKIKTPNGLHWLTIPVEVKWKYNQKIKDTKISEFSWEKKHWNAIKFHYINSKYFYELKDFFEELYLGYQEKYLSLLNYRFIIEINKLLNITTQISWSMDYDLSVVGNTEKLIHLCKQAKTNIYLSGSSAKNYMDEELFNEEGIRVEWIDYSNYPEYRQIYPPFEHKVSIIDLIFNEGENAQQFIKSEKKV